MRKVGLIVALIITSLIGLILLQTSLLNSAARLREQAFRQNVFAALNAVVQKLQTGEAASLALGVCNPDTLSAQQSVVDVEARIFAADSFGKKVDRSYQLDSMEIPVIRLEGKTLYYEVDSPQQVIIRSGRAGYPGSEILADTFCLAGRYQFALPSACSTAMITFRSRNDSIASVERWAIVNKEGVAVQPVNIHKKIVLVSRVVDNLTEAEWQPIERRVNRSQLDSLINAGLRESNIGLKYAFGVTSGINDSLPIAEPLQYAKQLSKSEFRTRLFPNDFFAAPSELVLFFPEYRAFIKQKSALQLALTILFMMIITICFAYTIRTIYRQKQFAVRTVDFINNMTHEFRTPLSSVALACDALLHPDIAGQPDKVLRYGRMISDENLRMQGQVDKILQMAVLEEKDYELTLTEVDVHEVIRKAIASMALLVENRSGKIESNLEATHHVILADEVHFANVIHNLLENANKYSLDHPCIAVSTMNKEGGLVIHIKDQGIGIPEKDYKLVFEKYYRVYSGNIHDVRGFGIGLSYVKLLMEAMGGKTGVESEPGKGTTIELFFPLSVT